MSCAGHRAEVQTKFSPTVPHFFKIILEQTLGKKLQIPKAFWMKYCGSLSSQVILKLPCGSRWEVGLTKSDGKVWIEKGWNKFAEYYSLSRGDLLVFRYENSQFNVTIFEKTTVEIEYPSNPNHFEKHVDTDEDDVSIEVLDSFSLYPKTRVKSQPHKKMRPSEVQSNLSHLRSKVMQKGSLSSRVESGNITGLSTPRRYQKPSYVYRNTSSLGRGNYFQSEYPSFTVIMKASYTSGQRTFHIPCRFSETYINKKECEASLWVSNGKSWSVYYKVKSIGGYTAAQLSHGWKAFALENSLEVGDICTFELMNNCCGNEISFRVSIVKGDDADDDAHNYLDKSTKMTSEANTGNQGTNKRPLSSVVLTASEAASHFFSKNPSFQVALLPDHVQGYKIYIPLTFASLYLEEKAQTMTLWVGEEYWHVKLIVNGSEYKFSPAGWGAFAIENTLQPSDVCIFELIKRNQPEMKVTIIRENFLYF